MSSFTPINRNRPLAQFINPLQTLHNNPDEDSIYSLQPEPIETEKVAKGKKRGAAPPRKAKKGRRVSLGVVWNFFDEDDTQSQNEGQSRKRRKTAPILRSNSMKETPPTFSQFWEPEAADAYPKETEYIGDTMPLQLNTPPDSEKKHKQRKQSTTTNLGEEHKGPFQNAVVTQSLPQPADKEEPQVLKTMSSHQGYTTTIDAVKSKSNFLAKTTLSKLSAFRYKPSNTQSENDLRPSFRESRKIAHHNSQQLQESANGSADGYREFSMQNIDAVLAPPESEYSIHAHHAPWVESAENVRDQEDVVEDDMFFSNATWNPNANFLDTSEPRSDPVVKHLSADDIVESSNHPISVVMHESQSEDLIDHEMRTMQHEKHSDTNEDNNYEDIDQRYAIPSSSAGHASQTHIMELARSAMDFAEAPDSPLGSHAIDTPKADSPGLLRTTNDPTGLSQREDGPNQRSAQTVYGGNFDLMGMQQSETSIFSGQTGGDEELDEFDEGLDDSDLLGIAFESIALERSEDSALSNDFRSSRREAEAISAAMAAQCKYESGKSMQMLQLNHHTTTQETLRSSSPQIPHPDSDDEFPMDEQIEEEMLKLTEFNKGVAEGFQAPASLQFSFGDASSVEVFDCSLQFSPPKSQGSLASPGKVPGDCTTNNDSSDELQILGVRTSMPEEEVDWEFLGSRKIIHFEETQMSSPFRSLTVLPTGHKGRSTLRRQRQLQEEASAARSASPRHVIPNSQSQSQVSSILSVLDDSHEYEPMKAFARPDFPSLVRDRSPIIGVTSQTCLRVCFRIGEMFKEGARCEALKQNAIIELFARVTFSSREPGTTKQHFQFADLWHDRPPFPNGLLVNYRTSELADKESTVFLGTGEMMVRCLGRLKRDVKNANGWLLHVIHIRGTDWEEVRWTKRIVSAGLVK